MSALSGCVKGANSTLTVLPGSSVTIVSEHEDITTHEDRKASTSSDVQFSENMTCVGGSVQDQDQHYPSYMKTERPPLFSGQGAVGAELKGFSAKQQLTLGNVVTDTIKNEYDYNKMDGSLQEGPQCMNMSDMVNSVAGQQQPIKQQAYTFQQPSQPFTVLIADFQHKRQTAGNNNSLRKQATVFEFLGNLKK